jgi:predicted NBD/HSP70 family sugar kinase
MIAFYCEVYDDVERLAKALVSLRAVYPTEQVVIVSDGSNRYDEIMPLAAAANAHLVQSTRMFLPESGHALFQRRIDIWSAYDVDYWVSFDTDALFHRPFREFPDASLPYVFGRIFEDHGLIGVIGGCYGITRTSVQLLKEKFNPAELPPVTTYNRPGYEELTIRVDIAGIHVWRQAGIKKRNICEFGVRIKQPMCSGFAVTHPHK